MAGQLRAEKVYRISEVTLEELKKMQLGGGEPEISGNYDRELVT